MSDERVYLATDVSQETLIGWLKASFKGKAYRLGMRPDDTDLSEFEPHQAKSEVDAWPQARVFDKTRELRWERRSDETYAVWVLGAAIPDAGDLEKLAGSWTAVQVKAGLFLWGRYDQAWTDRKGKNTWIEVRIPRPLHHPTTPPSENEADTAQLFARLGHIEYRAPNGAVQFTRLTEVT